MLWAAVVDYATLGNVTPKRLFERSVEFAVKALDVFLWPHGIDGFVQLGHLFADGTESRGRDGRLNLPGCQKALRHIGQD